MTQQLRIETNEYSDLITTRTINSRLWFVNNRELHERVLAHLAKLQHRYKIQIYAFNIQGNHYHLLAHFPHQNRADFMRDFNSIFAKLVTLYVSEFEGGKLWARRYANQYLPRDEDIEEYFFYCALQEIQAGLTKKISEYNGYNSFHDAVHGIERKYKITDWTKYNDLKRFHSYLKISDFTETYTLKFTRLSGYEDLNQREYKIMMLEKLESRRVEIVQDRLREGKGFLGRKGLLRIQAGTKPHNTKTSSRYTERPIILCSCPQTKKEALTWYFETALFHREASIEYLEGNYQAQFPEGTYKPTVYAFLPP